MRRLPKIVKVDEAGKRTIPLATQPGGEEVPVSGDQVAGRRCAATGKVISFERDARLCPECARSKPVTRVKVLESLAILGCDPSEAEGIAELRAPVGCDRCRGTGYRGRIGLFEIFRLNEEMHSLVLKRESTRTLAANAREHGMRTLGQSGWEKVKAGHTTLEEVLRVITVTEK